MSGAQYALLMNQTSPKIMIIVRFGKGEKMARLIDADALIRMIIRRIVSWYYKRTGFLEFSWGIDGHTDISIQSREYTSDGYRIGTREVKYGTD